MNILVVDDNRSIRNMHVKIIKEFNSIGEVFSASDDSEALKVLGEKSIELIITDVNMEPMNGLDMIREIRKSNPNLIIYVVASDPKDLKDAIQIGANKTFEKGTGDVYVMFDELKKRFEPKGSAE